MNLFSSTILQQRNEYQSFIRKLPLARNGREKRGKGEREAKGNKNLLAAGFVVLSLCYPKLMMGYVTSTDLQHNLVNSM